ncbi:hypothetical protein AXZ77_3711 [Thioclava sp. ES.031]|nr:hypothetical protein AXZ77_3711 [Thioclava sp. ES.031]
MAACLSLVLWTVMPSASHIPRLVETLQDHAQMIAEHGHSHGLEEDLAWALHGHDHEGTDHDHGHAVLPSGPSSQLEHTRLATWRGIARSHWSPPVFRLDRPPRA